MREATRRNRAAETEGVEAMGLTREVAGKGAKRGARNDASKIRARRGRKARTVIISVRSPGVWASTTQSMLSAQAQRAGSEQQSPGDAPRAARLVLASPGRVRAHAADFFRQHLAVRGSGGSILSWPRKEGIMRRGPTKERDRTMRELVRLGVCWDERRQGGKFSIQRASLCRRSF